MSDLQTTPIKKVTITQNVLYQKGEKNLKNINISHVLWDFPPDSKVFNNNNKKKNQEY